MVKSRDNSIRRNALYFALSGISPCRFSLVKGIRAGQGSNPVRSVCNGPGCPLIGSGRVGSGLVKPNVLKFGTNRIAISDASPMSLARTVVGKHGLMERLRRKLIRFRPGSFNTSFLTDATGLVKVERDHQVGYSCAFALRS